MIFYHFTSAQCLRGIGKHGLTIGDVPTDVRRAKGKCGVWLTTSPESTGHGFGGQPASKCRFRLTVDLPETASVARWSEWAPGNVVPETIENLKKCAGNDGPSQWETWFVRFGVVPRSTIVACRDMILGVELDDWQSTGPTDETALAVPAWRKDAWHRRLTKWHARKTRELEQAGIRIEL